MKKIIETIVEGAIGLAALYAVGHLAYQVGKEVTEVEHRYNEMMQKLEENGSENLDEFVESELLYTKAVSVQKKKHPILGKIFGNKIPVIGEFISNPENHKFEAFVDGDQIHIKVQKRPAP